MIAGAPKLYHNFGHRVKTFAIEFNYGNNRQNQLGHHQFLCYNELAPKIYSTLSRNDYSSHSRLSGHNANVPPLYDYSPILWLLGPNCDYLVTFCNLGSVFNLSSQHA